MEFHGWNETRPFRRREGTASHRGDSPDAYRHIFIATASSARS